MPEKMHCTLEQEMDEIVHLTASVYRPIWRQTITQGTPVDRPYSLLAVQAVADILAWNQDENFAVSYIQKRDGLHLLVACDHTLSSSRVQFLENVRARLLEIAESMEEQDVDSNCGSEVADLGHDLYRYILNKCQQKSKHKFRKHWQIIKGFCEKYSRFENEPQIYEYLGNRYLIEAFSRFSKYIVLGIVSPNKYDACFTSTMVLQQFLTASDWIPRGGRSLEAIGRLARAMHFRGDIVHALQEFMKHFQAINCLTRLALPCRRNFLETLRIVPICSPRLPSLQSHDFKLWRWLLNHWVPPHFMNELQRFKNFDLGKFPHRAEKVSNGHGSYHCDLLILDYLAKFRNSRPQFKSRFPLSTTKPSCQACYEVLSCIDYINFGNQRNTPEYQWRRQPRTNGQMCVHGWRLPPGILDDYQTTTLISKYRDFLMEGLNYAGRDSTVRFRKYERHAIGEYGEGRIMKLRLRYNRL